MHDTPNPLPQRYQTEFEGIGGLLKDRPEDFLVEELPLYDPCGKGEHLYLFIEKHGVSHGEMIATIRKHFNVREREIGFAGMKDKAAITRQLISVHVQGDPESVEIEHEGIRVLWADRHTNKLRRGHLKGNRFSIHVRNVNPLAVMGVTRVLRSLETSGAPNYFGSQRFGYRANNHLVGISLLKHDWAAALDELLGAKGTDFPDHQRERRELYDAGDYGRAAELWTPANRTELIAIKLLAEGKHPEAVCRSFGKPIVAFWLTSLQSAIFNRVLDRRIEHGMLEHLIEGDLAWKHDSRAVFHVTADDVVSDELARRLSDLDVSPSGPLWAQGMTVPGGDTYESEVDALAEFGLSEEQITRKQPFVNGARRPMRIVPSNMEVTSGTDERGGYIRTAFDLPRGAYATVVLREVMRNDLQESLESAEQASVH